MSKWYRKVVSNIANLPDCIEYFEAEADQARFELSIKNKSLEKHSAELPGIFENRFSQLQEIEAILEHLNIQKNKTKSKIFRKYLEKYQKALSSRDAEKYVEGDEEYVDMCILVNEFAMLRNRFLSITKSLDMKQWQITNVTKLRVAGMDDAMVD